LWNLQTIVIASSNETRNVGSELATKILTKFRVAAA
jgi:hypothetical protein